MSARRKQLLDAMIKMYGFEHRYTIQFAKMCESFTNNKADLWDECLTMVVKTYADKIFQGKRLNISPLIRQGRIFLVAPTPAVSERVLYY